MIRSGQGGENDCTPDTHRRARQINTPGRAGLSPSLTPGLFAGLLSIALFY